MPDLRLVLYRCQQKPVASLVQHGHMWRGREGATLLPALETAHWSLIPLWPRVDRRIDIDTRRDQLTLPESLVGVVSSTGGSPRTTLGCRRGSSFRFADDTPGIVGSLRTDERAKSGWPHVRKLVIGST